MENNKGFNISTKAYLGSLASIVLLMIVSYALTFIIPSGTFVRYINEAGKEVIDLSKGFSYTEGGISFLTFLLSPILCLTGNNGAMMVMIIVFLLVIGAVFNTLSKSGLMAYALKKIASKYINKRYQLLFVVSLFFMFIGAFVGSFEEAIPLVPICVALTNSLGFDTLTGLSISLMAVGCGFSSGVLNAFTVGIAQNLAGLPMFSGISLRLLSFVLIYLLLFSFIYLHAKKVERSVESKEFEYKEIKEYEKGLKAFVIIMAIGLLLVLVSPLITVLRDYTLIIVALTFMIAGFVTPRILNYKDMYKDYLSGALMMLPAALMILMASSIKYILTEAKTLDTILNYLISTTGNINKGYVILLIYLIALIMNFFVPSGSAEAFMLMPIFIPIAEVFGISLQLCVLAYVFGDGFSNLFYPTNPALLVSLSITDTSYIKWAKYSLPFQLLNLLLTSGILLFGLYIGY